MKPKESWREKLAGSKDLPKVVKITDKMSQRWGTGTDNSGDVSPISQYPHLNI